MAELTTSPPGVLASPGWAVADGRHVERPRRLIRQRAQRLLLPGVELVATTVTLTVLTRIGVDLAGDVAVLVGAAWLALLACSGRYTSDPLDTSLVRRVRVILIAGAVLGLTSWFAAPFAGAWASPDVMVPVTVALVASSALATVVAHRAHAATPIVLVGHPDDAVQAAHELRSSGCRHDITAACVSEGPLAEYGDLPLRFGVEHAVDVALETRATTIVAMPGPGLTSADLQRLLWRAGDAGIHVCVATALNDVTASRMTLLESSGLDLVHVRPAPARGARRVVKEVLDRVVALLGLTLLSPLLAGVAVAIRLESDGPAIFRQERVGRDGRTFTMYKFRTMCQEAEHLRSSLLAHSDSEGPMFKMHADPRITRLGSVLRRYSVDELPQLVNVVLGHMSLIGPRPALPEEVAAYHEYPRRRLAVKPGLTGLWQVSGRSDLSWGDSMRLDVRYVDNWSLALDAAILWRTVGAVILHRGAY